MEKQENPDIGGNINATTTLERNLSGSSEIENARSLQLSNFTSGCISREKSHTSAQRDMYQGAHRGSVCDSEKLDMTYLQENEWKTMQYVSILEYYEADSYIPAMA